MENNPLIDFSYRPNPIEFFASTLSLLCAILVVIALDQSGIQLSGAGWTGFLVFAAIFYMFLCASRGMAHMVAKWTLEP